MLQNKIVRFFLVSGLNTVFGYGLFAVLVLIGLHYAIAGFIATVCGVLFNYKTTGVLVFKNNKNSMIFKFFGVYAFNCALSVGLLTLLERSGIDAFLSESLFRITSLLLFMNPRINTCIGGAILILPMGLLAYSLNHFFVFNKPQSPLRPAELR